MTVTACRSHLSAGNTPTLVAYAITVKSTKRLFNHTVSTSLQAPSYKNAHHRSDKCALQDPIIPSVGLNNSLVVPPAVQHYRAAMQQKYLKQPALKSEFGQNHSLFHRRKSSSKIWCPHSRQSGNFSTKTL